MFILIQSSAVCFDPRDDHPKKPGYNNLTGIPRPTNSSSFSIPEKSKSDIIFVYTYTLWSFNIAMENHHF